MEGKHQVKSSTFHMQLTSISRINLFLKNTKKKFSKSVYVI